MNAPHSQPAEKKRKRRIASDEAHAWARNLRLKNPYAKMILMDLAHHVDGEGYCFVGLPSLSDDCELAMETIRKRLAWLEEIGAIARFPQWIDENGRRNGEGKGKRTTDKIRLMIDASDEAIEASARGDIVDETEGEETEFSPPTDNAARGLNQVPETARESAGPLPAPQPGLQQPSTCVEGLSTNLNLNHEPEDSPPSVPHDRGGEGGEDSNDEQVEQSNHDDNLDGWQEFKREFEADGDVIIKSSLPMTLFAALNREERALLIKAARGLIYVRKQQSKNSKQARPKPAPQTFIRETDSWENWAQQAPPRVQDFHVIAVECREADAYRNLHRVGRGVAPIEMSGKYTLKRPLTPAEMVFAELPREKLWGFVDAHNQIASWLEFLSNALPGVARRPMVESHIIDNDAKRGFFAPWPWPPTKDGKTIPWPPPPPSQEESTGPPGDEDAA